MKAFLNGRGRYVPAAVFALASVMFLIGGIAGDRYSFIPATLLAAAAVLNYAAARRP